MIVDERMLDYILSLDKDESPLIRTIEQEAVRDYVPIIRKESRNLLRVLLKIKKPGRVLEVGTAIGFSAILMGECLPDDSHITTIEKYEKRIPVARENFKRAGMEEKITLIEGDASTKELASSIAFLSAVLHDATNRNVIILIDEYDVPLQSAFLHGYYDEMLVFLRTMMSSALKTNPYLERGGSNL